jgi:hypothetical protein
VQDAVERGRALRVRWSEPEKIINFYFLFNWSLK